MADSEEKISLNGHSNPNENNAMQETTLLEETRTEDEAEKKDDKPGVPDGGWGWWVVFGCCLMHFILGGYSRSYGVNISILY